MDRKIKKIVLGIVFFCIVLLVLLFFILLVLVVERKDERGYTEYTEPSKPYNLFMLEKNEISHHFIFPKDRDVGKDKCQCSKFFFGETNDEDYYLISNIGCRRFRCTGTCFCDDRKSSAAIISRSVNYLLVAATTLIAYKLAKEYFTDECKEKLYETCPLSSIRVESISCSNGLKSTTGEDDDDEKKTSLEASEEEEEEDTEEHSFDCFGRCLYPRKGKRNDKLKCGEMEHSGPVFLDLPEFMDQQSKYRLARKSFISETMDKYCTRNSIVITDPITKKEERCVGSYDGVSNQIDCEQIDPPPDMNVCRIS